jgi:hypothetical protein
MKPTLTLLIALLFASVLGVSAQAEKPHDVVVYGDSAAAVAAAVQAKRQGLDVVLVNTTEFLGGMTCSGLCASDIFHRVAVGGIAREIYGRIGEHYGKDYVDYFEPHVALAAVDGLVRGSGLPVVMNEQLDRAPGGVTKEGTRLTSFRTLSGKVFVAKVFIDASYVSDRMAAAGVGHTVGREVNSQYGETLNGAQRGDTKPRKHYTQNDRDHFIKYVDPYAKPGDPAGGLLPFLFAEAPVPGEGDRRIQAYNYRLVPCGLRAARTVLCTSWPGMGQDATAQFPSRPAVGTTQDRSRARGSVRGRAGQVQDYRLPGIGVDPF